MRFKIGIVGSKFPIFVLFSFVFEGSFPSKSPRGAYIWRGDLTEGFLRYLFGGLIHGGAYFQNFMVSWGAWNWKRTSTSKQATFTVVLIKIHFFPLVVN